MPPQLQRIDNSFWKTSYRSLESSTGQSSFAHAGRTTILHAGAGEAREKLTILRRTLQKV
jgi:hypothetical protein